MELNPEFSDSFFSANELNVIFPSLETEIAHAISSFKWRKNVTTSIYEK